MRISDFGLITTSGIDGSDLSNRLTSRSAGALPDPQRDGMGARLLPRDLDNLLITRPTAEVVAVERGADQFHILLIACIRNIGV